jgi:hypothetical protein
MASIKPKSKTATRTRTDGRRPLLVYLHHEVIKQLKKVALDEERPAYEITEEAVREWLATHKSTRGRQDE